MNNLPLKTTIYTAEKQKNRLASLTMEMGEEMYQELCATAGAAVVDKKN